LQRVYFAADLIGLFVGAAALVLWVQRSLAQKRSPGSLDVVAWGLLALDGSVLLAPFSPWRGDVFGSDFSGPAVIITMFFAVFVVAQVTSWVRSGSGSRSE
jgi:glycerol uptake facilitator-like aquaporin